MGIDLDTLIDKEGGEGLARAYHKLEHGCVHILPKVQFVTDDFINAYFWNKIFHLLNDVGLQSLFEQGIPHDEGVKEKFKRKESLVGVIENGSQTMKNIAFPENEKHPGREMRVLLAAQATDHYLDVVEMDAVLDLLTQKNMKKKDLDHEQVLMSYAAIVQAYIESPKGFFEDTVNHKLQAMNESLKELTASHLDDLISNYAIKDKQVKERVNTLKENILKYHESSPITTFYQQRIRNWYITKMVGYTALSAAATFGIVSGYSSYLIVASKNSVLFTDYFVTGAAVMGGYLLWKYFRSMPKVGKKIHNFFVASTLKKNEGLKSSLMSNKSVLPSGMYS